MAHTAAERKFAFEAYLELRSVERVADITGIPAKTIERWYAQEKWKDKLEKETKAVVSLDSVSMRSLKIAKKFGLSLQDAELFRQVRKVETICFAVIENKKEVVSRLKLKPETFDSAMKSLKICWDTRKEIFSIKSGNKGDDNRKVNYIAELNQYFGDKGATAATQAEEVVPRRIPHTERNGDNRPE